LDCSYASYARDQNDPLTNTKFREDNDRFHFRVFSWIVVLPGSQPSVFWRIAEERSYNHSRTVGHVFENHMKRCPTCLRVYPEESLRFCRVDGTVLAAITTESQETLIKLPTLERRAPDTQSLQAEPASPRLSQITFDEAIEEYAAWLPSGDEILFSRERAGLRKVFRKNVVTGEEEQLTKGGYDEIQPTCSPDGRTMLFVRARASQVKLEPGDVFGVFLDGDIWDLDLASGKETKLIENAFNPDWSPDGKRIAFDASWVGPRRIWVVDSQGHNPQQLTSDSSEAVTHVRPRWSPDGTKIVFQNIERTKFDVRIVDLSNGRSLWVTNDAVQDINPVWSPSGRVRLLLVLSRGRHKHLARARCCRWHSIASAPAVDHRSRSGRRDCRIAGRQAPGIFDLATERRHLAIACFA